MIRVDMPASQSAPGLWAQRTARVPSERGQGRIVTWLAPTLLLIVSLIATLAIGLAPRAGQAQYAVIGAPWKTLDEMVGIVAAADGALVDAGAFTSILFAQSDNPDFAGAAYRAGAWLVLDPVLLRGCLGSEGKLR